MLQHLWQVREVKQRGRGDTSSCARQQREATLGSALTGGNISAQTPSARSELTICQENPTFLMQPPGILTDKSWHSQCKNCSTTPPVPAEEQGLPGAQPGFPTPPWEGKLLLQLCHKGGLVNHTSMNSLLWAVPGRLSPHPTTMGTAELIKVWNGITITHTQSFRQQRLKQVFLVILHPTHSSSETEPSNALWLTSRAEYIAEFSLLKKK